MCVCAFYILFSVCVCVDELRNCECLYLCMCVCAYICKCVRVCLSMHVGMNEWYLGIHASMYIPTLVSMRLRIQVSLHLWLYSVCLMIADRSIYLGIVCIVYSRAAFSVFAMIGNAICVKIWGLGLWVSSLSLKVYGFGILEDLRVAQ